MTYDRLYTHNRSHFGEVDLPSEGHGAAVSFGLIPDLDLAMIGALAPWMVRRVVPGGTIWLTGFTTEDPALPHYAANWEAIFRTPIPPVLSS